MPLVRGPLALDQHLTAHPQVAEHRVAVAEGKPEVLASPPGADHVAAGQGFGEIGRSTEVAPDRSLVQHLDGQ